MKQKKIVLAISVSTLLTACPPKDPLPPTGIFVCDITAAGKVEKKIGTTPVGTDVDARYRLEFKPLTNQSATPGQGKYLALTNSSKFKIEFHDAGNGTIEGATDWVYTHNNQPLGDAIAFTSNQPVGDVGGVDIAKDASRVDFDSRDRAGNVLDTHELDKIKANWDDFPQKYIIVRDRAAAPLTSIKLSSLNANCRPT